MKKLSLLLSLMSILTIAYAQKIQVKKGVISRDGEPIAKFEGKASMLKGTDITIQSMEGTSLITITSPRKTFPLYEPIMYYQFQFLPLSKTVAFIPEKFLYSEKNLVEFLFENIGRDFITKDGLNGDMIDQFITNKSDSGDSARHDVLFEFGTNNQREIERAIGKSPVRFTSTSGLYWKENHSSLWTGDAGNI